MAVPHLLPLAFSLALAHLIPLVPLQSPVLTNLTFRVLVGLSLSPAGFLISSAFPRSREALEEEAGVDRSAQSGGRNESGKYWVSSIIGESVK